MFWIFNRINYTSLPRYVMFAELKLVQNIILKTCGTLKRLQKITKWTAPNVTRIAFGCYPFWYV